MPTPLEGTLARLAALGSERMRAQNRKHGVAGEQFGVRLGDIRKVAAEIKGDHAPALSLWETGNLDARLLAILLLAPERLTAAELDRMVRAADSQPLADWLNAYVVRKHPEREALRERWMDDPDPWAARAGWDLTAERIGKRREGLDLAALLDRIEAEMASAHPAAQWTMNFCLAGIGIHVPTLRARALAIGERLGLYRDYPVSKGCTSPFAPIWIAEMVRRQQGAK
ncbi:MAG: DNA alkylation repair protein [Thermoanaerobaculia bacterium]|nr:DNA alkylation repair protein [Thermoanaerobaculia bacterium]